MLWLLLLQVFASCLWLGHSEVVTSFASCSQFFHAGTPPNNVLEPQNPAWICQRYSNAYHFATLYNKDKRIPAYSAYIYQPGPGARSKSWFVEPQLINPTYPKNMDTEYSLQKKYKITPQQIGQSQAINQDYNNLKDLNRGHLSPSCHRNGNNSKWSTFTLTNIVPQNSTLNQGTWNDYETTTMALQTQGCNITYVIVGAVPGNTYISSRRVNVPSHIWSAACCQTNTGMKTWAVIAENNRDQVQNLTLAELETSLTQLYGKGKCWVIGDVPDAWSLAIVTPSHKKGCKANLGNYRRVHLASLPRKVMEQIVLSVITWHIQDSQGISPSQQRFRKGTSCLENLISFDDQMTSPVDEGRGCANVCLDFNKSFGTVTHGILMEKPSAYGLQRCSLGWDRNSLMSRPRECW
ncbi:hypothetical protein DUI87_13324 [Hirundo rustica rustica]|uniref:Endonuclease domain-containing 1 protein n=1 Tax=Hirundo rustica rustica TaxID=333673 RepID=A0A3M0KBE9_HIRRU|nr:hypothetical protein DUI87_13324 [Hirundo rustica rustica]